MTLNSNDYREIKAAKVWTKDILVRMVQDHKDGFTTRLISEEFATTMKDAQMRVSRLLKWGCIRARSRAVKPITWILTNWGLKMAEKWKDGNSPGGSSIF